MAYRMPINELYDQGNGTYKDNYGSIYNKYGYRIYNAPEAEANAAEASRKAGEEFEQELQWAREAMNKAGGFSFLNPLNWFSGGGSAGLGGGLLGGIFSGLAGELIRIWTIIFVIAMIFCLVVAPVIEAIGKGVRTIGSFFRNLFEAIRNGILFIWKCIQWFLMSWPLTFIDLFRDTEKGFFGNLIFRILTLAEIGLCAAYLIFLAREYKGYRRIPKMIASDIYEPAGILLVLETVRWIFFRVMYGTGFLGLLYNAFCLTVWVIIAELIIIAVYRRKYGLW